MNSPVTITPPADQTNNEGDTVSLSISAADSTSGTLDFTATGLPTGLKINTSSGIITGSVAPGTSAGGPYSVTVTANDGTYSSSQTFNWEVDRVALAAPSDQDSLEGTTPTLTFSGTGSSLWVQPVSVGV